MDTKCSTELQCKMASLRRTGTMALVEVSGQVKPNSNLLTIKKKCEGRVQFPIHSYGQVEEGFFVFTEMNNTQTHLLVNDYYRA